MTPDPRAAFFDDRANTWEQRCYPPETRVRLKQLAPLFGVKKGDSILDMGTGTGVLTPYLREAAGPEGLLLSMDLSFEMLRHAAQKESCAKGLVMQATAMRLPLQSASIDIVICFAAFPHFSNKKAALAEMCRVLRPGGRVCIAHLLSREELSRHHGGHSAVAEDKLPDDNAMRGLFAEAGFSTPDITDIPGRYLATAIKE
ncbi:class I SAM-dependent methyltransferase [Desulfovibrio sp. OttesenSCG-928-M14]|nr:class I SAM-dependent methyltransferase [Desulfovibrio sp. OttesenSCG-928-M14]